MIPKVYKFNSIQEVIDGFSMIEADIKKEMLWVKVNKDSPKIYEANISPEDEVAKTKFMIFRRNWFFESVKASLQHYSNDYLSKKRSKADTQKHFRECSKVLKAASRFMWKTWPAFEE